LNTLPTPPEHHRPAPQLFFWGAGNFGQFGMGPDTLGEYGKPKKHTWVEKGLEEARFGAKGAGIEAAAAGGLHTIFIDENGKVSILLIHVDWHLIA
jgi:regulator of chromosome condensation